MKVALILGGRTSGRLLTQMRFEYESALVTAAKVVIEDKALEIWREEVEASKSTIQRAPTLMDIVTCLVAERPAKVASRPGQG